MKRSDVLTHARFAGMVLRYHTWPIHRQQSVGEHTWQILRIYNQIWGEIPPSVAHHAIWHDAAELVTGDLPFPVKRLSPQLKQALDKLEPEVLLKMEAPKAGQQISSLDHQRLKMCDLIDMYEYGMTELAMGNKFAYPIIDDIGKLMDELGAFLPAQDTEAVHKYVINSENKIRA